MSLTLTIVEENGLTVTDDRVVITVGASGPQGATGAAGVGVPAGGTTGQVLAKTSNTNYDTQWVTGGGGGGSGDVVGPSSSVDGRAVLFDGTTGKLIKQATAAPVLEGDARLTDARTPTTHAASHQDGGTDELALDASQTTSGQFNVARLGTGTPSAYTFLDGTGAWTDNVPVYVPVKNTSGAQIAKGAPVYATGTVGATYVIEVSPADADVAAAMPALGLLESTLAVNATGYAVITGTLRGVDTNAYTVGQELYVSTTAGQLTGTRPTGSTAQVQSIGVVTRVNSSNGEILVGIGHVAEAPNSGIDGGAITTGTVGFARLPTGTTSSTVAAGNDARFTDARTPTAHKASHSTGGTDALAPSDIGAVPTSRSVTAGTGLTGGGDLSANRTLSVSYGTTAGTAAEGNDSRLTDTRTPTDGTVTNAKVSSSAAIANSKLVGQGGASTYSSVQSFLLPGVLWTALANALALGANTIRYVPFLVRNGTFTVDRMHVEVTTLQANSNLRCGVYAADSSWQPTGAALIDVTASGATTGSKAMTVSSVALAAGRYLACVVADANVSIRSGVAVASWGTDHGGTQVTSPSSAQVLGNRRVALTYPASLPNTGPAWTTVDATATPFATAADPLILLRGSLA